VLERVGKLLNRDRLARRQGIERSEARIVQGNVAHALVHRVASSENLSRA
jgi:hypothetical protein